MLKLLTLTPLALISLLALGKVLGNQNLVLAQEPIPGGIALRIAPEPIAQESIAQESVAEDRGDFWQQGSFLVQSQIDLLDRLESVLTTTDLEALDQAQLQLLRNDIFINNFLAAQNQNPAEVCQGFSRDLQPNNLGKPNPTITPNQRQLYCTLYNSKQRLLGLQPLLNRRLALLRLSAPAVGGNSSGGDARFNTPRATFSLPNTSARLPEFGVTVVGSPEKPAIADFRPIQTFTPVLGSDVQQITTTLRQELIASASIFPTPVTFTTTALNSGSSNTSGLGQQDVVLPATFSRYQEFLQQPQTGIVRIFPAPLRRQPISQVPNHPESVVTGEFPLIPITTVGNNPTLALASSSGIPRLALEIDNAGNLQIAQPGIDYGFIWNGGAGDLEQFIKNRAELSNQTEYRFFLSYNPPRYLEELQIDRRRFLTGKVDNFAPSSLRSVGVPLAVNQIYLVRLVQFQLPAVLLNRQVVPRRDRRYLDQILQTPSSDIVVALQPVEQHSDGSYTIVWRLVNQFANPQVLDLARYLDLE